MLIFQVEYITFAATYKLLELFRILFDQYKFPKSLPTLKKETGFSSLTEGITTYATCPECYSVYLFSTGTNLTIPPPPSYCTYLEPLNNKQCQSPIYKNNSNTPIKKTTYHCLINSIQKLYLRKNFEEKTEEWRQLNECTGPDDIMYHCSQGKMWRSILSSSGKPFVDEKRSLFLTLNAGNV